MREFDVILFGATGYTGEHTARALTKMAAPGGAWPGAKWAIAGRSASKLKAITIKWDLKPTGVIVADTSDMGSLMAMAARGCVVMNATGPYRFYGEAVVEACIGARSDYVDLCGEPEFIDRCMLKHADSARAAGVVIVHACAFDSVPADIGCLFTALQFAPPALCAHADMYHTFSVEGNPAGASGHATTFYAAVHGFGAAAKTRAQRKALLSKLEAADAGSSRPPPALGPKLKVHPGPQWQPKLQRYSFLFPGADVAVVRTTQRAIARYPKRAGEPHITPQFGASFTVASPFWAGMTALVGLTFNLLCKYGWGRSLLLQNARLFTLGTFSDDGPTEEMLAATSWKTYFYGKGWGAASSEQVPSGGFDRAVTCSVGGPEPGYIATAQMFSCMARFVKEERARLPHLRGGVYTPGAFVGVGGAPAVSRLIDSLRDVGIRFEVEEALKTVAPKAPTVETKRPAWQTALNVLALSGWSVVLAYIVATWASLDLSRGSPLMLAIMALESVCAFEVVQIALGMAKGNLPLGIILHYTRLLIMYIMPLVAASLSAKLVVLAWATTEVCRYPMFLAPSSHPVRIMRYAAPVLTFPLGAGGEAMIAYIALTPLAAAGTGSTLYWMVAMILPMNLLGGIFAYGSIVAKAMASLKPPPKEPKLKL